MNDQYYTREPESASHPVNCAVLFRGHSLQFETDGRFFQGRAGQRNRTAAFRAAAAARRGIGYGLRLGSCRRVAEKG